MTCELLHVGHLEVIKKCQKKGKLIVGLLTDKALEGYKDCVIPFKDRKKILEFGGLNVVAQGSLDPTIQLLRYKANYLVSGDGFEIEELDACKKTLCKPIIIGKKKNSTTNIKERLCKITIHK